MKKETQMKNENNWNAKVKAFNGIINFLSDKNMTEEDLIQVSKLVKKYGDCLIKCYC